MPKNKTKTLLFIGRFQPFHQGHLALIKKYASHGYFIKIGIGSSQKSGEIHNPFSVQEREQMILLALRDARIRSYSLFSIPDISNDRGYPRHVKSIVGTFDCIVTGNPWVKRCFQRANYPCDIHYFNEGSERIGNIKAGKIRRAWTQKAHPKGLPLAVYQYLKKIGTVDRLKEFKDPMRKVHYMLKANKLTISCAESCTGGSVGKAFITYSGASEFFSGGIIAYDESIKSRILHVSRKSLKKYGAVSPQVALEMSKNAKKMFRTTYAISSTGYADPSSSRSGLVFVAVSTPHADYLLELNSKLKTRENIIEYATGQGIAFLENILEKELLQ